MSSSESTAGDQVADLVCLQVERARANGLKPGEMVEGAEVIVLRRNPETGKKHFGLLKWGLVPNWAPDMSRPHFHARAESQCREIVAADYPLAKVELVAAIDAERARLARGESPNAADQRCDAAGRPVFPVAVYVQPPR